MENEWNALIEVRVPQKTFRDPHFVEFSHRLGFSHLIYFGGKLEVDLGAGYVSFEDALQESEVFRLWFGDRGDFLSPLLPNWDFTGWSGTNVAYLQPEAPLSKRPLWVTNDGREESSIEVDLNSSSALLELSYS